MLVNYGLLKYLWNENLKNMYLMIESLQTLSNNYLDD
jgi:hypothetical protein